MRCANHIEFGVDSIWLGSTVAVARWIIFKPCKENARKKNWCSFLFFRIQIIGSKMFMMTLRTTLVLRPCAAMLILSGKRTKSRKITRPISTKANVIANDLFPTTECLFLGFLYSCIGLVCFLNISILAWATISINIFRIRMLRKNQCLRWCTRIPSTFELVR